MICQPHSPTAEARLILLTYFTLYLIRCCGARVLVSRARHNLPVLPIFPFFLLALFTTLQRTSEWKKEKAKYYDGLESRMSVCLSACLETTKILNLTPILYHSCHSTLDLTRRDRRFCFFGIRRISFRFEGFARLLA